MPQARDDAEALVSGQPSSRSWRALQYLQRGKTGTTRTFECEQADGSRHVPALKYGEKDAPSLKRPAPIAELRPGIRYVEVARADKPMFDAPLDQLATARAVIDDVRGYPKDFNPGKAMPAHVLDHAERATWMHIPRYTGRSVNMPAVRTWAGISPRKHRTSTRARSSSPMAARSARPRRSWAMCRMTSWEPSRAAPRGAGWRHHLVPGADVFRHGVHRHDGYPSRRNEPPPGARHAAGCAGGTDVVRHSCGAR
jgi:hypothetical protein